MQKELWNIIKKQQNLQLLCEEIQDYMMCCFPPDDEELQTIAKRIIGHRKEVAHKRKLARSKKNVL